MNYKLHWITRCPWFCFFREPFVWVSHYGDRKQAMSRHQT